MKKMVSFSTLVPRICGSRLSQFAQPDLYNYYGILPFIILN
jgi:hypothetical protein